MDIQDALYKINTFLNQYHSHFTQKLTYDKNNIQVQNILSVCVLCVCM